MIAAILSLVVALIGYFTSKKAGADDATAAAIGVAAGAGTYWTATQTDWGKAQVDKIDTWFSPAKDPEGVEIKDGSGAPVMVPPGISFDPDRGYTDGSKWYDTVGDVLKDWGPMGTAGVVGAGVIASKSDFKLESWMVFAGVGILALVVLK